MVYVHRFQAAVLHGTGFCSRHPHHDQVWPLQGDKLAPAGSSPEVYCACIVSSTQPWSMLPSMPQPTWGPLHCSTTLLGSVGWLCGLAAGELCHYNYPIAVNFEFLTVGCAQGQLLSLFLTVGLLIFHGGRPSHSFM